MAVRPILIPALSLACCANAAAQTMDDPTPKGKRVSVVEELAAKMEPTRKVVYKTVGTRDLDLHVFLPQGWKPGDRRLCFISFHGGGWTGGNARRMYPYADHFAALGMVGISVEYRLIGAKGCRSRRLGRSSRST